MVAAYDTAQSGERIERLPDGRWLVSRHDDTVAVIDSDGSSIEPSAAEVAALRAMSGIFVDGPGIAVTACREERRRKRQHAEQKIMSSHLPMVRA